MSVNASPPGVGTIIQLGFGVADWLNRGRGISREQRAQLDAARDAGYTRQRDGWRDPAGNRMLERDVFIVGRSLLNPPASLPSVPDETPAPRRRTPGGPGYRPPAWQVSPLPRPWIPPATDTEVYEFERDSGISRGFVGPVPTIPDTMPRTVPARTIGGTVAAVLARAIALPWLIFYPSRTADDDVLGWPQPQPMPRGPTRRPRIRVPTLPDVLPPEAPYPVSQPRFPGDFEREPSAPGARPDILTSPRPGTRPAPRPGTRPGTRPAPVPTTAPTPRPPSPLPFLLPYLPLLMPRVPPRPARPVQQLPRPPQFMPDRPTIPLTAFQPDAIRSPAPADPCATTETKKRRRRSCTNPITSRRVFKKGRATYRTITRKLEC